MSLAITIDERSLEVSQCLTPYLTIDVDLYSVSKNTNPSPRAVARISFPNSAMPPPSYHPSSAAHTLSTPTTATTITQTSTPTPVLRLRAIAPAPSTRPRIQWADDVVDNEGLGRKSSKGMLYGNPFLILCLCIELSQWVRPVCCIYHAPHPVGESSSDSSSDSDSSDSDSDGDNGGGDDGKARLGGKGKAERRRDSHGHRDGVDGCGHDHDGEGGGKGKGKASRGKRKPNAYETVPHVKAKTVEVKT